MGAFSNDLEAKIVEHFLVGNPQAHTTEVYLALFTADPGESGAGASDTGLYVNYARVRCYWTNLDPAGQTKNSAPIEFNPNGNASASVIVTHAALFTALTGGTMLLYGPLAPGKTLAPNDVLAFATNALVMTLD